MDAEFKENAILLNINRLYRPVMSADELYEAVRGNWKTGERRNKADYAMAVYQGTILEVYKIERWYPATIVKPDESNRWRFDGKVADHLRHYVGRNVEKGYQNPVHYVNC